MKFCERNSVTSAFSFGRGFIRKNILPSEDASATGWPRIYLNLNRRQTNPIVPVQARTRLLDSVPDNVERFGGSGDIFDGESFGNLVGNRNGVLSFITHVPE